MARQKYLHRADLLDPVREYSSNKIKIPSPVHGRSHRARAPNTVR